MGGVGVVTDSAADVPALLATELGITVVPLTIRIGDREYADGTELGAGRFWELAAAGGVPPSTAPPSVATLADTYASIAASGAEAVVSVHLSSRMSLTCEAARAAAASTPQIRVEIVDSLGVSAATGLAAMRAARLAAEGSGVDSIVDDLARLRTRTHTYATVDSLDYLRRGRRIGGAQALLGTMLQVKPVVTIADGVVEAAARVRTRTKALEHLAAVVEEHAPLIERLVVVHGAAPDIEVFVGMLRSHVEIDEGDVWTLGPVAGSHTGPGSVGVVFVTRA